MRHFLGPEINFFSGIRSYCTRENPPGGGNSCRIVAIDFSDQNNLANLKPYVNQQRKISGIEQKIFDISLDIDTSIRLGGRES